MEEERVLLTVWDDAGQEPEAVADVELRPARAAVAAVAQRVRRHRAVSLPAGHRAAYGVCRTHAYRQGQGKGSRGREGALSSSSSSSLTDDGGEDGGERGEEVGGGHGAEGQERHRHNDRGRGRGGAGNPCSAEHLGRSGSLHRSLDLARLSWTWRTGLRSALGGGAVVFVSFVVAFLWLRFKWEGGKGVEGARAVGKRGEAMRGRAFIPGSRAPLD